MGSAESFVLQGISKECFPGCENKGRKNCVFLPAVGKQNATFSPDFTKPGKRSLEIPCMHLAHPASKGSAPKLTCVSSKPLSPYKVEHVMTQPGVHLLRDSLYIMFHNEVQY